MSHDASEYPRGRADTCAQHGFALIGLVFVIATAAVGLVALASTVPGVTTAERSLRTEQRATALLGVADHVLRIDDSTAGNLDDVTTAVAPSALVAQGEPTVRLDPHGGGQELELTAAGNPVTFAVTGRGPDGRLGTADDTTFARTTEWALRAATRRRLTMLRAAFLASPYMAAPTMNGADRAVMAAAVRDWARSRRGLRNAARQAERDALEAERVAAEQQVRDMRTLHLIATTPPANATGPGGLLEELGLPDSLGLDAFGRTFATDEFVGFTSLGSDGVAGGVDDL